MPNKTEISFIFFKLYSMVSWWSSLNRKRSVDVTFLGHPCLIEKVFIVRDLLCMYSIDPPIERYAHNHTYTFKQTHRSTEWEEKWTSCIWKTFIKHTFTGTQASQKAWINKNCGCQPLALGTHTHIEIHRNTDWRITTTCPQRHTIRRGPSKHLHFGSQMCHQWHECVVISQSTPFSPCYGTGEAQNQWDTQLILSLCCDCWQLLEF